MLSWTVSTIRTIAQWCLQRCLKQLVIVPRAWILHVWLGLHTSANTIRRGQRTYTDGARKALPHKTHFLLNFSWNRWLQAYPKFSFAIFKNSAACLTAVPHYIHASANALRRGLHAYADEPRKYLLSQNAFFVRFQLKSLITGLSKISIAIWKNSASGLTAVPDYIYMLQDSKTIWNNWLYIHTIRPSHW